MALTTVSLVTKVRNISGATRSFGYLGAHGKTLIDGEEFSEPGDLISKLQARGQRGQRELASLGSDLNTNLVIVSTPKDHHYDAELDTTKVIQVDNGSVSAVDPSWGGYSSSEDMGEVAP